jgi:hypothetical protein
MDEENKILEEILKSIQKIKYGEVVITIHNSKIVQIERREKKRFDTSAAFSINPKRSRRVDLEPTVKMEAKI